MNQDRGLYLTNFQHQNLLASLEDDLRPEYQRRIKIMLLADKGYSQANICKELGCSQEAARYWISMAKMGQAHTWSDRSMGRPKVVSDAYMQRLAELVKHHPRDYGYAFERWTAQYLSKQLAKEFAIEISSCHINRLLKKMGLSTRRKTENADTLGIEENSYYHAYHSAPTYHRAVYNMQFK